jgi:hypothetical protein
MAFAVASVKNHMLLHVKHILGSQKILPVNYYACCSVLLGSVFALASGLTVVEECLPVKDHFKYWLVRRKIPLS